ncbi:coiled-coil domain-containing protein 120 [Trichomycterus rosablanca]|uniref:coiled-coil domain-containing protein 120 n=1 Tax=Trichomycterus rosablanca TaxID=2290929 RepID=UPI002F357F1D
MATDPIHWSTHEHSWKVKTQSSSNTHDMEVKAHLITGPEPHNSMDSKHRAERMVDLQERRRSLQALLSTQLAELRRVCLQEAELTGVLPNEFPTEAGEKPPHVRHRVGSSRSASKPNLRSEEEDAAQRKLKKTLFSSTLRRHTDVDQQLCQGKRTTVHRGCHTDNAVRLDSSSMSDSTSQENEELSDGPSPSCPWANPGSPDGRFCRKLSPVEIYYEMRARRNSVSSSASPSRTLPRSVSNLEGRSVPATPQLTRNGVHIRSESSSGTFAAKQRSDNPEMSQAVPVLSQDDSSSGSFEPGGCPYSTQTRRSNSSDALLDRTVEDGGQLSGHGVRNGSHKSSEVLVDGRVRQVNGHAEVTRVRSVSGGRGTNSSNAGYSDVLLDYMWTKQQKMHSQQQQRLQAQNSIKPRVWQEAPSVAPPPYINGFPSSQALIIGPPAYSPMMLRGKPGEPRRVKVSRTKSCGPFIPVQHHQQGYTEMPLSNGHAGMAQFQSRHKAQNYSTDSTPGSAQQDEPTRHLHKALALEGLRDWYMRNALGQSGTICTGKGQEGAQSQRRRTTALLQTSHAHPPLKHQSQSFQGDTGYTHLPQSATFHGHPLHGMSVDLTSYQETFSSKMQEMTLKEMNDDRPSPGTLV